MATHDDHNHSPGHSHGHGHAQGQGHHDHDHGTGKVLKYSDDSAHDQKDDGYYPLFAEAANSG